MEWVRETKSGFIILAYKDMIVENFEPWKPRHGEWCVFWERKPGVPNTEDKFVVCKYGGKYQVGKARGLHRDMHGVRHMFVATAQAVRNLIEMEQKAKEGAK